MGGKAMGGWDF